MKLNKTTKIGLVIFCFGLFVAIAISVISMSLYHRIYFFDGYEITAIGWSVVIVSIILGGITIIYGCINRLKDYSKATQSGKDVLTRAKEAAQTNGAVYFLEGARGRIITVYDDKVVLTTRVTAGSLIAGNATDGEKTIYYVDCIGVQFKRGGMTLGYLQFETASGIMNNRASNMFNENSFTWDPSALSNETVEEVANFVKGKIDECKRSKSMGYAPAPAAASSADELKKFKDLLDAGIISQEEFDSKKKQLLGL